MFRRGAPLKRACRFVVLAALASIALPTLAEGAPRRTRPAAPAPKPAAPQPPAVEAERAPPPPPPDFDPDWRQVMMAPGISGDLRAIAVDPTDEQSIYVATREGTLVHSVDGGVTWTETWLSPFSTRAPTIFYDFSGDPYKAVDVWSGVKVREHDGDQKDVNPLGRPAADAEFPGVAGPHFVHDGNYVKPFRLVDWYPWAATSLLETVAPREPMPYDEIEHMVICPGGSNKVLIVTSTKLLGSADGFNFVELYTARDSSPLERVACSYDDPNEVILTSTDGTFRSLDGGFSFEMIGQIPSSSVVFGPRGEDGKPLLFLVAGMDLWIGSSNDADAMNPAPIAGEGRIIDVAVSPRSIWVTTDVGVRVSRDGGNNWEVIEELEGFPWFRISVATDEAGREQVLVLRDDMSFMSTDDGQTFRSGFRPESRRRLRWSLDMPPTSGGPPSFLILTSGEVWSDAVRDRTEHPKLAAVRGMAIRRLKEMPSVREIIDRTMTKALLTDVDIDSLHKRWRRRAWLPGVDLGLQVSRQNVIENSTRTLTEPQGQLSINPEIIWETNLSFIWEIPEIDSAIPGLTERRVDLYEIRKRLSFFVEDAYQERRQVLSQLAGGGLDEEQALTLQARLEVLDVVIDEFTNVKRKH